MRRLKSACAAALTILVACVHAQAQDAARQTQFVRLLARTEARARGARYNFERLLASYPAFLPELRAAASRLGTNPDWLLNVIACESSFIPSARNPLPGQTATGLLQFIERTAQRMGTTTSSIRRMSPVEQLRLVERYLAPFRGRLNSLADVYAAVFRGFIPKGGPETLVAPLNNTPVERRAYLLNRGLDLSGDGRITKGELAAVAFSVGRFSGGVESVTQGHPPATSPSTNPAATVAHVDQAQTPPRRVSLYVTASVPGGDPAQPAAAPKGTRSIYAVRSK